MTLVLCVSTIVFYTVHRTDVFCLFDVASTYAVVIEVVSRGIVLVLAYVVKEEGHAGFFFCFPLRKGIMLVLIVCTRRRKHFVGRHCCEIF